MDKMQISLFFRNAFKTKGPFGLLLVTYLKKISLLEDVCLHKES